MTNGASPESDRTQVSRCLEWGLQAGQPWTWSAEELGAVLEYEMASPLSFDLRGLPPGQAEQLRSLCAAQGMLLNNLTSLVQHPHPPLEALKLLKDFAKTCARRPNGPLPPPVAQVIYYATIASALCRRGQRISALTKAELDRGLQWVLSLPWVKGETRALIESARQVNGQGD
jgi:hypothetical protein